ncbi:metal-dependent hydrolase [Candidatus Woesearchaeota archaeon]|nr:metal-dependent hydrolase [Candidatus Woesearchaeota archaeon]
MNPLTHSLAAVLFLFGLYRGSVPLAELFLFGIVFSLLPDLDILIAIARGKSMMHLRSWLQEPFGVLAVAVPIGAVLSLIRPEYFLMTVVPYGSHVIIDYLALHKVKPLAPFRDDTYWTGFVIGWPRAPWHTGAEKGIPENYLTAALLLALFLSLFLT